MQRNDAHARQCTCTSQNPVPNREDECVASLSSGCSVQVMCVWRIAFLPLLLFFALFTCAAADQNIQMEDSTLPVVNFKYEFPASDMLAGSHKAEDVEGLVAFQKRSQHLIDAISKISEASTTFASVAQAELDELALVLQKVLHLTSTLRQQKA